MAELGELGDQQFGHASACNQSIRYRSPPELVDAEAPTEITQAKAQGPKEDVPGDDERIIHMYDWHGEGDVAIALPKELQLLRELIQSHESVGEEKAAREHHRCQPYSLEASCDDRFSLKRFEDSSSKRRPLPCEFPLPANLDFFASRRTFLTFQGKPQVLHFNLTLQTRVSNQLVAPSERHYGEPARIAILVLPHGTIDSDKRGHFLIIKFWFLEVLGILEVLEMRLKKRVASSARVSRRATLGARTRVGHGSFIGAGVQIGKDCVIEDNVSVRNSTLGDRVKIKAGSRIGGDGFGFHPATQNESVVAKPQELRVVLGDDVQIGSNCAVDRGSWRDTVIGARTKLDNLIQVGHNVQLGEDCLIAAQTGIAGSVTMGNGVLVGGQTGIAQYCKIGDHARIAAKSGVIKDVLPNSCVGGMPAVRIVDFHRQTIFLQNHTHRGSGQNQRS